MSNAPGHHVGKLLQAFIDATGLMDDVEWALDPENRDLSLKEALALMMKVQDRISVAYGHLMSISCECEVAVGVKCRKHGGDEEERKMLATQAKAAKKAKVPEAVQWKCLECGDTTTSCSHVTLEEIRVKVEAWMKSPEFTQHLHEAIERCRAEERRLDKARQINPVDMLTPFGPIRNR